MNSLSTSRLIIGALLLVTPLESAEDLWLFDGVIQQVDEPLHGQLQPGWVLAGEFTLDASQMEEAIADAAYGSGRLVGGIGRGFLEIQLYYQQLFAATQVQGSAGVDYFGADENEQQLAWFIPFNGELANPDWSLAWLQIWLYDDMRRMIPRLPVRFPPHGIDWRWGWFRLTFAGPADTRATAEGRMELFLPANRLPETSPRVDWAARANDLAIRLRERDEQLDLVQLQLNVANERVDSLRQLVNNLIEERTLLEIEHQRITQRIEWANDASLQQIDALEAELALLQLQQAELTTRNVQLSAALESSLTAVSSMQLRLDSAMQDAEAPAMPPVEQMSAPAVELHHAATGSTGVLTFIEYSSVADPPERILLRNSPDPAREATAPSRLVRRPPKFR